MSEMTPRSLKLESVDKSFGGLRAIRDLTITIEPGMTTALIGPNGAGKTTIFNLISGFITPDKGRIAFGQRELNGSRPDQVAKLGIGRSFQDLKLFKELSCWDNIMAAAAVSTGEGVFSAVAARRRIRREEAERAERVEQILEFTGLQDKRDVLAKELGYAEAKMLALARVLTLDSKTLLLDEPCSGLDHGALDRVREMLAHLVETGHTICLIEHNMALVRDVADVGIFLENGALVAMDSIDNLLSDSGMRERYLGLGEQE
jgi:ABC-type branched-subunit amino acid transport system ATPase component